MVRLHLPLLALLPALSAALALPAQDKPAGEANTNQSPDRLSEWPKLPTTDADRVLGLVGQFKKPEAKLYEPARQQLIQVGEAAMPLVMQQCSDRPDNVNDQLFQVFDAVLTERHAALMSREAQKPRLELRRYLTMRLSRMAGADLVPFFEKMRKDADEQTAFFADLALLARKRRDALPGVTAYARKSWTEALPHLAAVLPAARSLQCGTWVFESITKAAVVDQMTGLRLLRFLATNEHAGLLRGYFDAPDNAVKGEACNVARVLHGEEPIEKMPVFKVIQEARKWKEKL
ncbi:MAG: hypothetical protein JNN13_09610 [Planctomycetes bacterium]|nr:hypothetical protein [Planctomycetota bacterium]